MVTILFALLAGILTIAAPCTLPVLPILLGSSIGQTNNARPAFIALGFVVSFAAAAIVLSAITKIVGLDQDTLRNTAIGLLAVFGTVMLCPGPFERLSARVNGMLTRGDRKGMRAGSGNIAGFVLGTTLGLVWTPCAGPVLASIITVIATESDVGWEAVLLVVYAAGAAVPMLAIAYGGQLVTTRVKSIARVSRSLQQGFGVLVIVFALAMYFQYDTLITAWFAHLYPNGRIGL